MKHYLNDISVIKAYLSKYHFRDVDHFQECWRSTCDFFMKQNLIPAHYKALIRYFIVKGVDVDEI